MKPKRHRNHSQPVSSNLTAAPLLIFPLLKNHCFLTQKTCSYASLPTSRGINRNFQTDWSTQTLKATMQ